MSDARNQKSARFCHWLDQIDLQSIENLDQLMAAIALEIAAIEKKLTRLVRQVLHHPRFQQLESAYRNLHQLVQTALYRDPQLKRNESSPKVNIFVLDITAQELQEDLSANSHRQTWLYDKLYRKRFDLLIGRQTIDVQGYSAIHPFSLIIVNFDFCFPKIPDPQTQIGLNAIRRLARIGEECFCMFLLTLAPQFFGDKFKTFASLEEVQDVRAIVELDRERYRDWNDFRNQDDSRMIGICLPRILIRKPYKNYHLPDSGIQFNESDGFLPATNYLWGSSAFAVAEPIIRSFQTSDWFTDICGVDRESAALPPTDDMPELRYDGGLIRGFPELSFETDSENVANYPPVETTISESDEAMYASFGLIPLFSVHQSPFPAILTSHTPQISKQMTTTEATNSIRLSTLFNYMLCVCRMAHHLKLECRSKVGKSNSPQEFEDEMQGWLMQFASGRNRGHEQKMLKPFLDEQTGFSVEEDITDPGKYDCQVKLCPHHKFDGGRVVFEAVTLQMQVNADEER